VPVFFWLKYQTWEKMYFARIIMIIVFLNKGKQLNVEFDKNDAYYIYVLILYSF